MDHYPEMNVSWWRKITEIRPPALAGTHAAVIIAGRNASAGTPVSTQRSRGAPN